MLDYASTPDLHGMVRLRRYSTEAEGHLAKAKLESLDIPVQVVPIFTAYGNFPAGMDLLVRTIDFEKANGVLEPIEIERTVRAGNACPKCHFTNVRAGIPGRSRIVFISLAAGATLICVGIASQITALIWIGFAAVVVGLVLSIGAVGWRTCGDCQYRWSTSEKE